MIYTAITIGPISDTLAMTSSPAGLWGASYLFSWVARELLQELVSEERPPESFISPYFELDDNRQVVLPNECEGIRAMGVGMFHDRIVFEGSALDDVNRAAASVIQTLARSLPADEAWLKEYIKIYATVMDVPADQSPLMEIGPVLSALELEPAFPTSEKENPLLSLFENARIKNSFLTDGLNWFLLNDGCIRDIPSIAGTVPSGTAGSRKPSSYYAVLNSDGDNMSAILEEAKTPDAVRKYSKTCLLFCAEAADIVNRCGGIPIYAGGDDLLAIVPFIPFGEDGNVSNLIGLVNRLNKCFNECFDSYIKKVEEENETLAADKQKKIPSLSLGVSVQFEKYPLYEARAKAESLLFDAKSGKKNALRLHLQKHSGQSCLIALDQINQGTVPDDLDKLIADIVKTEPTDKSDEKKVLFLSGAGSQIEGHRAMFLHAFASEDDTALKNLFANLFDNCGQERFKKYLDRLCAYAIALKAKLCPTAGDKAAAEKAFDDLAASVRLLHFTVEEVCS